MQVFGASELVENVLKKDLCTNIELAAELRTTCKTRLPHWP
jgi:hypothetical protein